LHSHPKYLPRGSRRQAKSRASHLQVARSLADATSSLQGEAQVLYPKIHKNPRNNTSKLKTLQTNFFHRINPTIKHDFSIRM